MAKTVLIIEDNADLLEAISFLVEDAGYKTILSVDGEILSSITEIKPDLILLDHDLGQYNGADYCKQLKADNNTAHYPILLLSGNEEISQIVTDCGADGFIAKPFSTADLLAKIKIYTEQ